MLHCCLNACQCQQVVIPVSLKHSVVLHGCSTLVLPQGEKKKASIIQDRDQQDMWAKLPLLHSHLSGSMPGPGHTNSGSFPDVDVCSGPGCFMRLFTGRSVPAPGYASHFVLISYLLLLAQVSRQCVYLLAYCWLAHCLLSVTESHQSSYSCQSGPWSLLGAQA